MSRARYLGFLSVCWGGKDGYIFFSFIYLFVLTRLCCVSFSIGSCEVIEEFGAIVLFHFFFFQEKKMRFCSIS